MIFIQNKITLSPDPNGRQGGGGKNANNRNTSGQNPQNRNQQRDPQQRKRVEQNAKPVQSGKPTPQNPRPVQKTYRMPKSQIPEVKEPETLYELIIFRFRKWYDGLVMHGKLKVEVNRTIIIKSIVYGLYFIFAALLQTTVFARFRLFGAVPDLMLTSVIVFSMYEGEKFGAVFGIFAGYIIDALGSTGISLMPLVYMLFGYICGILTVYYLTNSLAVWGIYMAAAVIGRGIVSLIYILGMYTYYPIDQAFAEIIIPEMGSTLIFSVLTYGAVRLISKPFRKRRRDNIDVL